MANVIRTQFQGKDGRLNIDTGILTLYGGSAPVKWDITKRETTQLLRDFLNAAYSKGKHPNKILVLITNKNVFEWAENVKRGWKVCRWNLVEDTYSVMRPNIQNTKEILSAMVRANVKERKNA
jgi:hypothetical protein